MKSRIALIMFIFDTLHSNFETRTYETAHGKKAPPHDATKMSPNGSPRALFHNTFWHYLRTRFLGSAGCAKKYCGGKAGEYLTRLGPKVGEYLTRFGPKAGGNCF